MPKNKSSSSENRPASDQIRQELRRMENRSRFGTILRNTMAVILSVAAIAVLVATFLLPVLRIYGNAMNPNVAEGEIVVALKTKTLEQNDVIAFYCNNRILVRRVIASGGDVVNIDRFGLVDVNEKPLAQPYKIIEGTGTTDIEYPFRVPDGCWFVLGDNRMSSVDSRNTAVGCVSEDQLVGKVLFCVWPFKSARMFATPQLVG